MNVLVGGVYESIKQQIYNGQMHMAVALLRPKCMSLFKDETTWKDNQYSQRK